MRAVLLVAAMVTGGAGTDGEAAKRPPPEASWRAVGKSFSTLKREVATLRSDYRAARDEAKAPR